MGSKNKKKRDTMVVNGEEFSRTSFERAIANKSNVERSFTNKRSPTGVWIGAALLVAVCSILLIYFNPFFS